VTKKFNLQFLSLYLRFIGGEGSSKTSYGGRGWLKTSEYRHVGGEDWLKTSE